jgi:hypothetical protein
MTAQASQGQELPRPAVLGIASGIFFLTFFGAFWGFTSAALLSGPSQVVAFLLVGLVTLGFFVMGVCFSALRVLCPRRCLRRTRPEGREPRWGLASSLALRFC